MIPFLKLLGVDLLIWVGETATLSLKWFTIFFSSFLGLWVGAVVVNWIKANLW